MLRRLAFRNFKSWPEVDIELGQITGLFGTNSSGKTSLIQFLLLLKQTKDATDRKTSLELNGPYVGLGVYGDMIHRHEVERPLSWSLAIKRSKALAIVDPTRKGAAIVANSPEFEMNGGVAPRDQDPVATRLSYRVGEMTFSLEPKGRGEKEFELSAEGGDFRFIRNPGRPWQLPGPIKSYAFPDQARI